MSHDDILDEQKDKVFVQDYSPKAKIDGVKIVEIKNFVGEDGDLSELLKLDGQGNVAGFENFSIKQINRSLMIPKTVKAWHIHFNQDEIWYVSPHNRLFLGLWDIRKDSPTKETSMRVPMGGGTSKLVFIPRGVAHGAANYSGKKAEIYYFLSEQFDINNPDENRLTWDALGANFWELKKE